MRFLFITLPLLLIAAMLGIVADRWAPTKTIIDDAYERISPTPLPADPGFAFETPLVHSGSAPFQEADINAFAVRNCLDLQSTGAETRAEWLQQYQGRTRDSTIEVPAAFPVLEDHPGLIKLELIRSPGGADRSHCGATRISEHWFMTAAHCFEAEDEARARPVYAAMALSPSLDVRSEETTLMPIERALCHGTHGTSRFRYPNDLALFYLEDVSAFANVPMARIEDDGLQLSIPDFDNAYLAAWGRNGGSRYFQGGPVRVSEIGEAVLVSQPVGAMAPDIGDSGSPLYVDFGKGPVVVGILSQINRAAADEDDMAVYVRTRAVRAWMERTMAICEQAGRYVC